MRKYLIKFKMKKPICFILIAFLFFLVKQVMNIMNVKNQIRLQLRISKINVDTTVQLVADSI